MSESTCQVCRVASSHSRAWPALPACGVVPDATAPLRCARMLHPPSRPRGQQGAGPGREQTGEVEWRNDEAEAIP